jgi:thiamine biosynthesis lipoprotein
MSKRVGTYQLPVDAKPLLDMYRKLYQLTDGAVTPLIGATMESTGYDAGYSLKPGTVVAPPSWDEALEYDFPYLTVKQPVLLDFGAAGKGYLTDIVGTIIEWHGVRNYYIDAGGDILYSTVSGQPVDIALEHPTDPESAIGIAHLLGGSLCGSSGSRRSWGKYHHTIDPRSLESPTTLAAVWVTADSGLVADGLTTALYFTGPDKLERTFDFEYAVLRSDMALGHSDGFPADFFTTDKSGTI